MYLDESNMAGLSPEELERRAAAHIDGVQAELSAAAAAAREAWSPRSLARRHPLATAAVVAAVAGGGGLLIARAMRARRLRARSAGGSSQGAGAATGEPSAASSTGGSSQPPGVGATPHAGESGAQPSSGRVFTSALLSALAGAAGRAIPALLVAVLASRAQRRP